MTDAAEAPLTFGAQIRAARIVRGLTVQALADIVGVDRGYLSKCEADENDPGADLRDALADALDVDAIDDAPAAPAVKHALPVYRTERPLTRGDCEAVQRPCAWSDCRWHTAGGVDSCVLDIADRGAANASEIARALGISHTAVEQIEARALRKLREATKGMEL